MTREELIHDELGTMISFYTPIRVLSRLKGIKRMLEKGEWRKAQLAAIDLENDLESTRADVNDLITSIETNDEFGKEVNE